LEKRESLAAAMAALFMGPEHNKILIPRLVLGTKEERMVSAIAIGFSGNAAALKPLKTAICDSDAEVQKAAAFGLSGLKNGEADDELIEILLNQLELASSADVRAAILVNLKLFARPSLEPVFLSYSYSSSPETQITALGGLLFCCSPDGLERSIDLLQSERPAIRATALSVLERHGSRKDLESVFPVLGDENPRVRNLARETIQRLREKVPNSVGWVS
jgi:HEAT repeat protein